MTVNGITINNISVCESSSMSILQLCEKNNIIVPRFCYHERLSIAGNCRMCLVEIEKFPKLVVSCATPIQNNLVIFTESPIVKRAREGILEFLLLNHPLDCPICDQSGECDLQDQSNVFGSDRGRFYENKRASQDKDCSPLIKTIMTRCIHCTRCVRFSNEVLGVPYLGTTGRGNALEISFYVDRFLKSEFSGNLIDLCPVGALTAKPYAFIGKAWELQSIESIDTLDAIGSNIRIDTRSYEILRVLPKLNEEINEEWISDKTRFAFDSLKRQRFYNPLLKIDDRFQIISWKKSLNVIATRFKKSRTKKFIGALGNQSDLESTLILKDLVKQSGGYFISSNSKSQTHFNNFDIASFYKFNSGINRIESCDVCLLIGVNPRIDGAILNLHLRKRYLNKPLVIGYFGSKLNLTFPVVHLGCSNISLLQLLEGKHMFSKVLCKSKAPLIIFGKSLYNAFDSFFVDQIYYMFSHHFFKHSKNWFGVALLSTEASNLNKCEVGIKEYAIVQNEDEVFLGLGEVEIKKVGGDEFLVSLSAQGCSNSSNFDLILPSCAYTEKKSFFFNTVGQLQQTNLAIMPPGEARTDFKILLAIKESVFGYNLCNKADYFIKRLRNFHPLLINCNTLAFFRFLHLQKIMIVDVSFLPSTLYNNFYQTNTITSISPIMAKCSSQLLDKSCF